jgi:nitrous oxidase accessory protein
MHRISFILFVLIAFAGYGKSIVVFPGSFKNSIKIAANGDTLLLQPGVYKEGNIIITKSLTVIGKGNVVIDGENKYEILTLSGNNITVKKVQFKNAGYSALNDFAAIKIIDAKFLLLDSNLIVNAYFAIHVSNSSYVTIKYNGISGSPKSEQLTGNGIHLWKCNNAVIENNFVQGHRDGIYFEFVTNSTIRNNLSENNIRYGLHFMFSNDDVYSQNIFRNNGAGVAVMYSKKVKMLQNRFELNWGPAAYGILLKDISDSYIGANFFIKNTVGVHLEGTSRMQIEKNTFQSNGWAVKIKASCEANNFLHNNFLLNSFDVGTNGTMVLNTFDNNYWDKYEGYDINSDGVGDVPYHPVSMYSMIVEENPFTLMLFRSFATQLLDKAEKAMPSLTPENLVDNKPIIKPLKL